VVVVEVVVVVVVVEVVGRVPGARPPLGEKGHGGPAARTPRTLPFVAVPRAVVVVVVVELAHRSLAEGGGG
jgi:hypothetical protein